MSCAETQETSCRKHDGARSEVGIAYAGRPFGIKMQIWLKIQEGAGEHRSAVGRGVGGPGPVSAGGFRDRSGRMGRDQPLEGLEGKAEELISSPGNEQPKPNTDLLPRPQGPGHLVTSRKPQLD